MKRKHTYVHTTPFCLSQTQLLLQRGLELYESHCDPDGKEIAYALCELARLYTSLQRFR